MSPRRSSILRRAPTTARPSSPPIAPLAASAGLTLSKASGLSLTEIAAAKFNRDADGDDRQSIKRRGDVTVISRSVGPAAYSQLAANVGLSPEAARDLTLSEIAGAKFARESDDN